MMILIVKACFLTGYRDDITEAITKDAGCDSAHAGPRPTAITEPEILLFYSCRPNVSYVFERGITRKT